MCHAPGQPANGFHFLSLAELFFELLAFADVRGDAPHPDGHAGGVADGGSARFDLNDAPVLGHPAELLDTGAGLEMHGGGAPRPLTIVTVNDRQPEVRCVEPLLYGIAEHRFHVSADVRDALLRVIGSAVRLPHDSRYRRQQRLESSPLLLHVLQETAVFLECSCTRVSERDDLLMPCL